MADEGMRTLDIPSTLPSRSGYRPPYRGLEIPSSIINLDDVSVVFLSAGGQATALRPTLCRYPLMTFAMKMKFGLRVRKDFGVTIVFDQNYVFCQCSSWLPSEREGTTGCSSELQVPAHLSLGNNKPKIRRKCAGTRFYPFQIVDFVISGDLFVFFALLYSLPKLLASTTELQALVA